MQFQLLLPCSGPSELFGNLLRCLSEQTVMPTRITALIHTKMSEDEHREFLSYIEIRIQRQEIAIELISNISYPDYQPGRGVGYDRNFLLQHAKENFGQYIYMIDQDNEFEKDHFEKILEKYQRLQKEQRCQNILLSPTVERRRSGKIQSRGILRMYYLFPKYIFNKNQDNHVYSQVQMVGGNSLFGPMQAMQAIGFDEQMKHFCEDIDFSYRWFQSGAKIFVAHDIRIHHMERDQTPLSSRCLHTPAHAYSRAYNRIRFVKKTASFFNKRSYLLCGVWIQTVLFLGLCFLYGGEQKWKLIGAVWRGTRDGVLEAVPQLQFTILHILTCIVGILSLGVPQSVNQKSEMSWIKMGYPFHRLVQDFSMYDFFVPVKFIFSSPREHPFYILPIPFALSYGVVLLLLCMAYDLLFISDQ